MIILTLLPIVFMFSFGVVCTFLNATGMFLCTAEAQYEVFTASKINMKNSVFKMKFIS